MTLAQKPAEPPPAPDEATIILSCHQGDALEAIRTLIAERDAMFRRLLVARGVTGRGFTRGWMP